MTRTIETITVGNASDILAVAPRTVSDWIDNGTLKGERLLGSKDRRVNLADLINFMGEYNFPRIRLLRFIENHAATKEELGGYRITNITESIGTKNLHFYPDIPPNRKKPDILTSGNIAKLRNCNSRTASKFIDKTQSFGYRPPFKEEDRRVSVDNFVRLFAQSNMPVQQRFEAITPLLVGYPGGWQESQKIIDNTNPNESLWYRKNSSVQEVSIRRKKDGLYVKSENDVYSLILLGMDGREKIGEIVPPHHLKEIWSYIQRGIDLLNAIKNNSNAPRAKEVLENSQKQLNEYLLKKN